MRNKYNIKIHADDDKKDITIIDAKYKAYKTTAYNYNDYASRIYMQTAQKFNLIYLRK